MLPTCLVTGASSFVARALVPRLAQTHRLRLLVRPGQRLAHFASIPHERVEGRLENEAAIAAGLRGVDVVVHLAAIVSFCHEDRRRMFEVNDEGTQRLLQLALAAGVRRALHVSTISAVGYTDAPRELDERAPYNFGPLRIGYSDSKRAAEERALEACRDGLEVVIVNPPSMYGAGDRRKGDDSLLGAVMEGRVRVAPPGGTNVVNVADVCEGMLAALARGRAGERYILGGENLTGLELIQRIAQVVGGRAPQRAAPRALVRAGALALRVKERCLGSRPPVTSQILQLAARYMWYSSEKAARELDWRAGPVDAGIAAAWAQIQSASAATR
ncbi:MAG: NAD-dependent epimerase/dehydratase family protein [Planctomycetota bacterium]|nr:NAD-dependent epimerase/dehydratase family protein [Planctomycetota bacterium]